MQARMKNPVVPEAMQALLALAKSAEQGGVPPQTLSLVHLRASQINDAAFAWTWRFASRRQKTQTSASSL